MAYAYNAHDNYGHVYIHITYTIYCTIEMLFNELLRHIKQLVIIL